MTGGGEGGRRAGAEGKELKVRAPGSFPSQAGGPGVGGC